MNAATWAALVGLLMVPNMHGSAQQAHAEAERLRLVTLADAALAEIESMRLEREDGDLFAARNALERALEIYDREGLLRDEDHIFNVLDDLAHMNLSLDSPERAVTLWERALSMSERISPRSPIVVSRILNNLGVSLQRLGHHERALPLCQRRVRQAPLDISVPMGGEWILDRAQTDFHPWP